MKKTLFLILGISFLQACTNKENNLKKTPTLFSKIEANHSNIDFTNTITETEKLNIFKYRNFYNGGGVAIGDINNDGLQDIFFTANMSANKLYLNEGNFQFKDITTTAGIAQEEAWSTGVVMVDINDDGLLDLYVCNAGLNENSTPENKLYINKGENQFEEQASKYGLNNDGYTTHASFFDYDLDGDLDAYILNNSFIPVNTLNYSNKRDLRAEDWKVKDFLKGGGDVLLENVNGKFVDVSEKAGIYGSLIGFGLGVTVGDINDDHYPDIYVSNDFFERDYLYINNQNGTFSEELENRIGHISHSSMGADMADINNDGALEIFVTDMLPDDDYRLKTNTTFDNIKLRKLKVDKGFYNQFMHNTLQLNDGKGNFKEISHYSGVHASDWSWGALMFDADNDSHTDILVCNGVFRDVIDQDFINFFANDVIQDMAISGEKKKVKPILDKMPSNPLANKIFKNLENLKFEDAAAAWGLDEKNFSNGAAYGDLDNDGDLDLVINNLNQQSTIYKNNSDNNFISFKLTYQSPNRFAIGSKVKTYVENQVLTREINPARGFQSSVGYEVVIGLGAATSVDSVEIIWSNGKIQTLKAPSINQTHEITYSNKIKTVKTASAVPSIFKEIDHSFQKHEEDNFIDFYYERNIPFMLSREGPCMAKGDFDNDGKVDLYIGGAAGQAPILYKNTGEKYVPVQEEHFKIFKEFEDTYATFFDADNDGDLDLIVGSGGNNVSFIARAFHDRLYLNNGGKFEFQFNSLPTKSVNTSVIRPHDFDNDGDLDLFVGGRSIPGDYAVSPGSSIYLNNGKGQFLDVTRVLIPELSFAGMVTDAMWVDVLPNKGKELLIVGEWMAPRLLSFTGEKFEIVETNLSKYSGWWQTVQAFDVDNDGDLDLGLGNMGENFSLPANAENPLKIWINDFDDNGSIEKLITQRLNDRDMPVVMKGDLVDQLPHLKKKNIRHAEYAKKSLQDLFDIEVLTKSTIKQINCSASLLVINEGEGQFSVKPLHEEAQLSCINDIVADDVNGDGFQDLILAGNNNFILPQFSMVDASSGLVLLNDQNGSFVNLTRAQSGLNLKGVTRQLDFIEYKGRQHLVALLNDDFPKLYCYQSKNE